MKPNNLILKCYAEGKNDLWQAFCLDFDLSVQGESFEEVREKLDAQIREYLHDALIGEDKAYAGQLLSRRAPLTQYLKFYYIVARIKLSHAKDGVIRLINEPMPLTPGHI